MPQVSDGILIARCDNRTVSAKQFDVVVADGGRGRLMVPVPFDPDVEWGAKTRHPVGGTINGKRVRGVVEAHDGVQGFLVGVAWLRDCPLAAGDEVHVELAPEGPQRADLADDVAAALEANPKAGEFFDALAQFYRRGYLRWIDGTTRRPEVRRERIARMVELLESGVKDYRSS